MFRFKASKKTANLILNIASLVRSELSLQAQGADKVNLIEHCLAVSGSNRVRAQILLETSGGLDSDLDCYVRFVSCPPVHNTVQLLELS